MEKLTIKTRIFSFKEINMINIIKKKAKMGKFITWHIDRRPNICVIIKKKTWCKSCTNSLWFRFVFFAGGDYTFNHAIKRILNALFQSLCQSKILQYKEKIKSSPQRMNSLAEFETIKLIDPLSITGTNTLIQPINIHQIWLETEACSQTQ